jgi:hypothetical protein
MKPLTKDKQKYFMVGEKVYLEKDIKDAVEWLEDRICSHSKYDGTWKSPILEDIEEAFPALYSEVKGKPPKTPTNLHAKDECEHNWVDRIGEDKKVIATLCEKCGKEQTKEGVE